MSGNWDLGGVSSQGRIREFEKGGGGGRGLCHIPNRQGVWGLQMGDPFSRGLRDNVQNLTPFPAI